MNSGENRMENSYCIIRAEKIKTMRDLCGRLRHNVRSIEVPNASPERSHLNLIPKKCQTVGQCVARFRKALGSHKPRKNAVLAREFIVTASPEMLKSMSIDMQKSYFKDSVEWIKGQMGGDDANLISVAAHFDEETPHLHVICACMLDGKLNDRAFLGGHKNRLVQLQTDFHRCVASKFGLERGLEKSRARHTPNKVYAAKLKKEIAELENSIEALEERKSKIDRDIRDYSKYAYPMLLKRLQEHFKMTINRDGNPEGCPVQIKPDKELAEKVKPEFHRVERGFRP